jgi:hypothetical protein
VSAGPEWGPLARLAGIWEGDTGEDVAYSNEKGSVGLTPCRQHTIDVSEDGVFSYEEVSLIAHGKVSEHLSHTDSNTLYRIADA